MTRPPTSRLRGLAALLAAGTLGATAALTVPAGAETAARAPVRLAKLAKLAKFAKNSDKVDGKHAVGAGATPTQRRGKLVATDSAGRLPNDIIRKAPDADRLDGIDGSAYRFLNLDVGAGLVAGTTATYGGSGFGQSGLRVPDATSGQIGWGFTLPPNFPTGATMRIRVLWHIAQTGCDVSLRPNAAWHQRTGLPPATAAASAGLTGPDPVTVPAVSQTGAESVFTAAPPRPGSQFRPGDSYTFSLFRQSSDTCTQPVQVTGVSVTY